MNNPLVDVIKLNAQTFEQDDKLPKLPVPDLEHTFDLYLRSIKALISDDLTDLENKIRSFIDSDESKKLQSALKSRSIIVNNWLESWWLDEAYLKSRQPLIPCWNISGHSNLHQSIWKIIENKIGLLNKEIIHRASRFIYSLTKFWLCLRLELVIPNESRNKIHLSMSQFRFLFNTCRIPDLEKDSLINHFQTATDSPVPTHIALGCNGRIFVIKVVNEKNRIHHFNQIFTAIDAIVQICANSDPGYSVAALTSLPRSEWAKYYNSIRNLSNKNVYNMDMIEKSIFWVCLNNQEPPPPSFLLEKSMKVDCRNVWADKSLYVTFYTNGLISFGSDHAPFDGVALGFGIMFVEDEIICGKGLETQKFEAFQHIIDIDTSVIWEELVFNLPSNFKTIINDAHFLYLNRCQNIEARNFTFSSFSRKISRIYKLHPDTVFQLFLQLAFYKFHGLMNIASVYETATTRQFRNGRTETIRSCTIESVKWIKAIITQGPSSPQVLELFLDAHRQHNSLRTLCENGNGFDRHLFGLIMASRMSPDLTSPLLEEIINHPSWASTGSNNSFILSTSPMGSARSVGAVAPMSPNGYGVFYRIVEDCCEAAVTSWRFEGHGKGLKLLEELNICFGVLPLMFQSIAKPRL